MRSTLLQAPQLRWPRLQVGNGSVSSTKMPPGVAGALQGALNNQVRQDLSNAINGH